MDKREDSISKKQQMKTEAIKKVAVLVKELIGNRSIRKTGEESGVAASYITGILKEKYLPSAEILRKLTLQSANPQNGITLEDLMVAAGYQQDYADEAIKDELYYVVSDRNSVDEKATTQDELFDRLKAYSNLTTKQKSDRISIRKEISLEISRLESLATAIIYKALSESGIHFSKADNVVGIRGFRPDFSVYVPKQPILEWWFDLKYLDSGRIVERGMLQIMLRRSIGQIMFIEPKLERKISLVVANKDIYYILLGFKDKLSYRGDLSVILIDKDDFSVVSEVYLAHYKEQDKSSEFYII